MEAYRYGALLFGAYAEALGGVHVLQPKRARLFLADRLQAERALDEKDFAVACQAAAGGHVTMLHELIAAEMSYRRVERQLCTLWEAAPAVG